MNTIYFVSRAKTTGPINQSLNILNGMKQNGRIHSVLVTLEPETENDSWLYRFKEAGIDITQLNVPLWKTFVAIPKLRKYVKDNAIDIIHASGFRVCFVTLLANTKAKIVITQRCNPNEIVENLSPIFRPILNRLYLCLIKKIDVIVACSKSIQMNLLNKYKIISECVQNGVNTSYFKPLHYEEKRHLKNKLNLPVDKKIFLVLGCLIPRKNNNLIIDAFLNLNPKDTLVVFVGKGTEEELLRKRTVNCDYIKFVGHTNSPIEYLQSADILISASLSEGLPNTVLEALSCGVPCILSDIDSHKELIENTEAGVLFKNNSVSDLCSCITESLSWDLSDKSQNARTTAIERFGIKSLAAKYEHIYRGIVSSAH